MLVNNTNWVSELLTTPFETIERNVREQLESSLSEGGFNASKIFGYNGQSMVTDILIGTTPFDPIYDDYNGSDISYYRTEKVWNITIANADSAANAMLESAIEAYRTVSS